MHAGAYDLVPATPGWFHHPAIQFCAEILTESHTEGAHYKESRI